MSWKDFCQVFMGQWPMARSHLGIIFASDRRICLFLRIILSFSWRALPGKYLRTDYINIWGVSWLTFPKEVIESVQWVWLTCLRLLLFLNSFSSSSEFLLLFQSRNKRILFLLSGLMRYWVRFWFDINNCWSSSQEHAGLLSHKPRHWGDFS